MTRSMNFNNSDGLKTQENIKTPQRITVKCCIHFSFSCSYRPTTLKYTCTWCTSQIQHTGVTNRCLNFARFYCTYKFQVLSFTPPPLPFLLSLSPSLFCSFSLTFIHSFIHSFFFFFFLFFFLFKKYLNRETDYTSCVTVSAFQSVH